jgi:hypothetical protein
MNLVKKLIIGIILSLFFISCETYVTECATPSLDGKYVVSLVQIKSVDQSTSKDTTFSIPGETCVTPLPYPFDTFKINDLRIEFEGPELRMVWRGHNGTSDIWLLGRNYGEPYNKAITYTLRNCTPFYVGDLQFSYVYEFNGQTFKPTLTFFVVDDGITHLTLKSYGVWPSKEMGQKLDVSFFLTRD